MSLIPSPSRDAFIRSANVAMMARRSTSLRHLAISRSARPQPKQNPLTPSTRNFGARRRKHLIRRVAYHTALNFAFPWLGDERLERSLCERSNTN